MTAVTSALTLDDVHRAISSHGDNPSAFLALNSGNSYFSPPGLDGVIAYRTSGPFLVQFAGPFTPADRAPELLRSFVEFAAEQGRGVVSVQVQQNEVGLYAEEGFTVNQVGASYAVDLARFTLRGTRFMQLRNKIARAARAGLTVVEGTLQEWADGVAAVDRAWLGSKGEHAHELEFLVGQMGGPAQDHRRLFVGIIEGEVVGYISYSPAYGSRPGWLHDLSRRMPGDVPGIMESINQTAISTFTAEGAEWLHFGFTPFTSLVPETESPNASAAFGWFVQWLWEYGDAVYPAQSQLAYKQKWAPHAVLPEYIAFHGRAQAGGLVHVFKAAKAV
ncbi:bifunctional lysylphosphatidylglycerol flippase/synthetase MprF [Streptomyces olivaceoviridis]|uniref:bifunctional lysylphosphatidylglycerol flippase/synthetase MprF n=1 Tax=Streptomyces olivaceoviridis TaxID=1921 RepID=UPI0036FE75D5